MKNFKLLLATTAILSTGLTMGANATPVSQNISNAATLNMNVKFISAVTLAEDLPLNFGTLINPAVGEKVGFVAVEGCSDITRTWNDDGESGYAKLLPGTANRGRLTITGLDEYPTSDNTKFSVIFGNSSVTLTNSDSEACGTVTGFSDDYTFEYRFEQDVLENHQMCIKGTFTVTNIPAGNKSCTGTNTVTLVYTE